MTRFAPSVGWVLLALFSTCLAEDLPRPEIKSIEVYPTSLELTADRDSRHVLVTGKTVSGEAFDLTTEATYSLEGDAARLDEDHYAVPVHEGSATLTVSVLRLTAQVPVRVSKFEPTSVSFIREVLPIISKTGCNQGACHGGQQGKAGFKLSLRGYDPEFDYVSLVDDVAGRRFNRSRPEQSLMLLKPTQGVPHEGGFLFDEKSRAYRMIETWIAQGCNFDNLGRVTKIDVFPKNAVLDRAGRAQSQLVIAHFEDGQSRDVTRDVTFETSNFEVATAEKSGAIQAVRRGEASILVRYEGQFLANGVTVLGDREGFAWNNSPEHNYIDQLVNNKLKQMKTLPADLCTDAEFFRRVTIDLTGIPPKSDKVRAFLADTRESKTKREALIDELLESPEYVDHWTLKWSDLLMSNRKFISEKGVWAFRNWIRQSISTNQPYNEFVSELITANGSTFENPSANYYRIAREPKLVMENMTQVFLGTRFMCAQCHDHPFERWTQAQYYELSAYFGNVGRKGGIEPGDEIIFTATGAQPVLSPKTGKPVSPKFPYSHEGLDGSLTETREQLANWLTAKENPYFAKSIVNRYWSYLMGRGIIDPVDDIRSSNPPSNPELLEQLTKEFISSGFDLKNLLRTITRSHTYQRSIETNQWNKDDQTNYSHGMPRRLTAEQLYDAIMIATESPSQIPGVPQGFRATQLPDSAVDLSFLDMFGRPPRESPCECERTSEVSLAQTLNLINGPTIGDAIAHPQGLVSRLIAEGKPTGDVIDAVYLSVLGRLPSEAEKARDEGYCKEVGNLEGAQDLMWALINSPAFLFNR